MYVLYFTFVKKTCSGSTFLKVLASSYNANENVFFWQMKDIIILFFAQNAEMQQR